MALSKQQLCTFYVGKERFGIAISHVMCVIPPQHITPVPMTRPVIAGLINVRNQVVTLLNLHPLLGYQQHITNDKLLYMILITETGPLSIIVDRMDDVIYVDAHEQLALPLASQVMENWVAGAYMLEDTLLPVIDVEQLAAISATNASRGEHDEVG